tara:strand:- start:54 stop:224 length:171 start_codon:yes stop_codon:yes gene_type:complete
MKRDLATPLAPTFSEGWPKKRFRKSGKPKRNRKGMSTPKPKRVKFKRCKGGVCRMR